MLKYVKEGALDLLASTLPSFIESIKLVSDDDFLSPEWGNQQRQPRIRRRHNHSSSSRAVAPTQRHLLTTKTSRGLFSSVSRRDLSYFSLVQLSFFPSHCLFACIRTSPIPRGEREREGRCVFLCCRSPLQRDLSIPCYPIRIHLYTFF